MPTGYTADLHDGKDVPFEDFLLTCARAFGATITQRDEDIHVRPRPREPRTAYHDEALDKAAQVRAEAPQWTPEEAERRARVEWDEAYKAWGEAQQTKAARRERYENMIAKAREWEPPTPDHVELQNFMIQQLEESIRFDCATWEPPEAQTGEQYRRDVIAKAERDVKYHTKEREKEIERCAQANAWISALYDSLNVPVAVE